MGFAQELLSIWFVKLFLFCWGICAKLNEELAVGVVCGMVDNIKMLKQQNHYNNVMKKGLTN